jgi:hypothetical protein
MKDPVISRILMRGIDEKDAFEHTVTVTIEEPAPTLTQVLSKKLLTWGVEARGTYLFLRLETRSLIRMRTDARYRESHLRTGHLIGIRPVPIKEKTETRFMKIFFIWLSANTNILSYVYHFADLCCQPNSVICLSP